MEKRKIVIVILVIIVLIAGIVLIIKSKSSQNAITQQQQEETTNKVATKKENDKYEIYNTDIITKGGSTKLTATVKNKTNTKTQQEKLTIVLLDKQDKELGELTIVVPSLEKGAVSKVVGQSLTVYEGINDFKINDI